jgi:hypothetical protein
MEITVYEPNLPGLWFAEVVDYEGEGPRGEGKDKLTALCELARELWERSDEALFECLAFILEYEAGKAAAQAREAGYSSLIAAQADGWAGGLNQAARTVRGIV